MPRNIEPYIPNKEPVLTYGYEAKIPYNQTTKSDLFFQPTIASNKIESKMMPETWELTLERCIKSIVSIKYCRARGLDTEIPGAFSATGFVVDKERGILLSNRHVVSVSPITAHAVLCNYEEIELTPIYRDPVHDFGFFKYDPTQVRFLDIPNIELYPQGAKVGQDIRVVGYVD
jgi:S1-C subfamily serine protease